MNATEQVVYGVHTPEVLSRTQMMHRVRVVIRFWRGAVAKPTILDHGSQRISARTRVGIEGRQGCQLFGTCSEDGLYPPGRR